MQDLRVEARAKLTWGDKPSAVERFLVEKGTSPGRAKAMVAALVLERDAEFRRLGVRDVVVGAVLGAGCLGALVAWGTIGFPLPKALVVALGFGVFAGISMLGRGIHRMATGSPNRKG